MGQRLDLEPAHPAQERVETGGPELDIADVCVVHSQVAAECPDAFPHDPPAEVRGRIVENHDVDVVVSKLPDQLGPQPRPCLEAITRFRLAAVLEEDPDVDVVVPMRSARGVPSEEADGCDSRIRPCREGLIKTRDRGLQHRPPFSGSVAAGQGAMALISTYHFCSLLRRRRAS